MSFLADVYKKALDEIHSLLKPASASTPSDPSGITMRSKNSNAKEAQEELDKENGVTRTAEPKDSTPTAGTN